MDEKPALPISAKQYHLLSSPLRLRILHVLSQTPKTAKQVADELGETRGNIHYHITKLHEGGILELVETRQIGSIKEKYYRTRATRFKHDRPPNPNLLTLSTWLSLTSEEAEELLEEVSLVLEAWEKRTVRTQGPRRDFQVLFHIKSMEDQL
ncbi:ArsR/SmtB family transcription factor [Sulfobacillus harzensis]|uniref:Helix-turn-helix transcriptional regulator n=1 Tax=Sulfobacillus harzensis TaxID=2729629 RepID=A0A7Y0L7K4_9FIRM|nr:helix-turn-helix domain-containing protein [Sulfobacillus harzensis]NMP24427.1 helix-turn-helix transcriptional regulator [Sulfobacillus harzensis]